MAVWQIDIYENKDDATPSRRGYVEAATDSEASEVARNVMGDATRAELNLKTRRVSAIPSDRVVWE